MKKIFVLYNLKPDVTIDEYGKWSREVDQQTTPRQEGVFRFEPYVIEGGEEGKMPFTIVEDIEVDSWDKWQEVLAGEVMKGVIEGSSKLVDPSNVIHMYGRRLI